MKLKIHLYPEAQRLLFSTNLIQQTLSDLIPTHPITQKDILYITVTQEEWVELKAMSKTKGVSMTFLLNEAIIKRGRIMEANEEHKPKRYLVINLDALVKRHPQIKNYASLMQTCHELYYVPSPLSGIYVITNRVQEPCFKIAEEANQLNVNMKKRYWHVVTEEEYREAIPQGLKSYIGMNETLIK